MDHERHTNMVNFQKSSYGGWETTYTLSNGTVDLVITGDVGPRLIRFGFVDQPNIFAERADMMGKTGGDDWNIFGGHRFWHAPEDKVRTYYPDNTPISVEEKDGFIQVTQPTEPTTGIQKQLDIYMSDESNYVRVVHRLINQGLWTIECAPWALSVMATGGQAIIPLPPRGSHPVELLPNTELVLWPYTNMADPRWTWGNKYIFLRQAVDTTQPQKFGAIVPDGWSAYVNNETLFVKCFAYDPAATYPDLGCMVETFTNDWMLELETLGKLETIAPGDSKEHVEDWFLFKDVPTPSTDDEADAQILPHVEQAKSVLTR